MSEVKYSRRQQAIVDEAEREIAFARSEVDGAEDALMNAKAALRIAERQLHRINEMGDML